MHTSFYASGFLYNIPTQQILLHQLNYPQGQWALFGGKNRRDETPEMIFQRVLQEQVHLTLPLHTIHSVYDYIPENSSENRFIVYANINLSEDELQFDEEFHTNWFTFRQLYKLSLASQTKQDIMIGQRVVLAEIRKKEALQTPSQ